MGKEIDWKSLGFAYTKTNKMFVANYKDGKWDEGKLVEDDMISIHVSSTCLHYGQESFEGLKAYRTKSGKVQLFRPDMNSKRINATADRMLMPQIPEELFIRACKEVVKANEEFIPPYGTGGSLYLRPMEIGVGANLGVRPAPEYMFIIFVSPVGAYFKGGMSPVNFITTEYDRAAAHGTGQEIGRAHV